MNEYILIYSIFVLYLQVDIRNVQNVFLFMFINIWLMLYVGKVTSTYTEI